MLQLISLLGSWRETDGSYIKARVHRCFLLRQIMQKSNEINKCIKRKEEKHDNEFTWRVLTRCWALQGSVCPLAVVNAAALQLRACACSSCGAHGESLFVYCVLGFPHWRDGAGQPRLLTAARVWTHHDSSCRHTLLLKKIKTCARDRTHLIACSVTWIVQNDCRPNAVLFLVHWSFSISCF